MKSAGPEINIRGRLWGIKQLCWVTAWHSEPTQLQWRPLSTSLVVSSVLWYKLSNAWSENPVFALKRLTENITQVLDESVWLMHKCRSCQRAAGTPDRRRAAHLKWTQGAEGVSLLSSWPWLMVLHFRQPQTVLNRNCGSVYFFLWSFKAKVRWWKLDLKSDSLGESSTRSWHQMTTPCTISSEACHVSSLNLQKRKDDYCVKFSTEGFSFWSVKTVFCTKVLLLSLVVSVM